MRTRCALRAIFFQPSMVASVAHRTTVFYLGMWTRGTLCAVTRDFAVRTSVAPRAVAFHPIVQASFHSQAYFHPGIHGLLTNKSASAVLNNASVMLSQNKSSAPCAGVDSPISLIYIFFKYHGTRSESMEPTGRMNAATGSRLGLESFIYLPVMILLIITKFNQNDI